MLTADTADTRQLIPSPPDRDPHMPADQYGLCLFLFVLRAGITASLNDDQIELAAYAGTRASAIRPAYCTPDTFHEAIRATRERITSSQRVRTLARTLDAAPAAPADQDRYQDDGSRVPLAPRPLIEPPAGSAIVVCDTCGRSDCTPTDCAGDFQVVDRRAALPRESDRRMRPVADRIRF
jgi:hypothetical protein